MLLEMLCNVIGCFELIVDELSELVVVYFVSSISRLCSTLINSVAIGIRQFCLCEVYEVLHGEGTRMLSEN